MKAANDAVRFLVEIAALVAISYWAFTSTQAGPESWLGMGGPVGRGGVAIWMAPQSRRRTPEGMVAPIEVVIFGLATAALAASTGAVPAIVFAAITAVDPVIDHALGTHSNWGRASRRDRLGLIGAALALVGAVWFAGRGARSRCLAARGDPMPPFGRRGPASRC